MSQRSRVRAPYGEHFFASAKEYVKTGWEHAAARQGTYLVEGKMVLILYIRIYES